MTKWLASLLHRHKWKLLGGVDLRRVYVDGSNAIVGGRFLLQCTHCGQLKKWDCL